VFWWGLGKSDQRTRVTGEPVEYVILRTLLLIVRAFADAALPNYISYPHMDPGLALN
jgi:hypothetical protein